MSRLPLGALYDPWDLPSGRSGGHPEDDADPEPPPLMHLHTVVELRIGSASYTRCVADVFDGDALTITSLDSDEALAVWPAGTWTHATTYDEHGHPIAHYRATTLAVPLTPLEIA